MIWAARQQSHNKTNTDAVYHSQKSHYCCDCAPLKRRLPTGYNTLIKYIYSYFERPTYERMFDALECEEHIC